MPNIDARVLNDAIFSSQEVKVAFASVGEQKVKAAVSNLLEKFQKHPVTQEIAEGANASNTSGTLGGYGNLFSFIGFVEGTEPTKIVEGLIKQITFNPQPIRIANNKVFYGFDGPGLFKILQETPTPWLKGRSWLSGIERGISNLGHYINKKVRTKASRSLTGLQIQPVYRSASFKPVPYFETMWNEFLLEIQQ